MSFHTGPMIPPRTVVIRRVQTDQRLDYATVAALRHYHAHMTDPKGSTVYRYVAAYERWKLATMPLHEDEVAELTEALS